MYMFGTRNRQSKCEHWGQLKFAYQFLIDRNAARSKHINKNNNNNIYFPHKSFQFISQRKKKNNYILVIICSIPPFIRSVCLCARLNCLCAVIISPIGCLFAVFAYVLILVLIRDDNKFKNKVHFFKWS